MLIPEPNGPMPMVRYVPVLFVDGKEVSRYQIDRETVISLLAAGTA